MKDIAETATLISKRVNDVLRKEVDDLDNAAQFVVAMTTAGRMAITALTCVTRDDDREKELRRFFDGIERSMKS